MNIIDGSSLSSKVLKAMSLFTGVQSISIICSIVRAKLIALWIGTAGVGLFAVFNTVVEMMLAATQLNIRESAVRDVASADSASRPKVVSAVRWWATRLGLSGALLTILLSPALAYISFGDTTNWWMIALLSVPLLTLSVSNGEYTIMQGTGALNGLARSAVAGAVGGTVISVPLYYFFGINSVLPSVILFSIATMTAALAFGVLKDSRCSRTERIAIGKRFLKLGAYLTVPTLLTYISSYVFISYLNNSESTSTTGLYQSGYTLVIKYTGIVLTALSMEYFPRISTIAYRPKLSSIAVSHEMLIVTYVLTPLLVIFVISDELIIRLLYTSEFLDVLPFVTIGILAMVFKSVSYCMAYVILARGDGRTFLLTEASSMAVGLTLNILLFRSYSFAGLGVSFVIWYAIYTLIVYIPYRRYGMRLSSGAKKAFLASVVIVASSIFLKFFGWQYSAITLAPAIMLSVHGFKCLKN